MSEELNCPSSNSGRRLGLTVKHKDSATVTGRVTSRHAGCHDVGGSRSASEPTWRHSLAQSGRRSTDGTLFPRPRLRNKRLKKFSFPQLNPGGSTGRHFLGDQSRHVTDQKPPGDTFRPLDSTE